MLCSDNTRFMNHSDDPNLMDGDPNDEFSDDIAAKDINEGEELTYNYRGWDDEKYAAIKNLNKTAPS